MKVETIVFKGKHYNAK